MSPAGPVPLRTGPLTALLVDGALHDVRVAGYRAFDAVYVAVRDPDWGTVAASIDELSVRERPDGFTVRFRARHGRGFDWYGTVEGAGGALTFDLDGTVRHDLTANRIGFCLLHPIELAGGDLVARTVVGDVVGRFPDRIAPHQPFLDLIGLRYAVGPGASVEVAMTGSVFEMEDHRNWTDAGFKTYCPPLRRPHPVRHHVDGRIRQSVRIKGAALAGAPPASSEVRIGAGSAGRLPELVRSIVDVAVPADLTPMVAAAAARAGRVVVLDPATGTTVPGTVRAVREALRQKGIGVPVGGGTRGSFAALNRMDLDPAELDFVTYGIDPRVHRSEPDFVMDSLLAQPHTVRDAHLIGDGLPVVVRLAPWPVHSGAYHAAWLLGSVAALGAGVGAAAVVTLAPEPAPGWYTELAGRSGAALRPIDLPRRELAALALDGYVLVANLRDRTRDTRVAGQRIELHPYEVRRVEL